MEAWTSFSHRGFLDNCVQLRFFFVLLFIRNSFHLESSADSIDEFFILLHSFKSLDKSFISSESTITICDDIRCSIWVRYLSEIPHEFVGVYLQIFDENSTDWGFNVLHLCLDVFQRDTWEVNQIVLAFFFCQIFIDFILFFECFSEFSILSLFVLEILSDFCICILKSFDSTFGVQLIRFMSW